MHFYSKYYHATCLKKSLFATCFDCLIICESWVNCYIYKLKYINVGSWTVNYDLRTMRYKYELLEPLNRTEIWIVGTVEPKKKRISWYHWIEWNYEELVYVVTWYKLNRWFILYCLVLNWLRICCNWMALLWYVNKLHDRFTSSLLLEKCLILYNLFCTWKPWILTRPLANSKLF